jgi:cobalt/nickel transport protein
MRLKILQQLDIRWEYKMKKKDKIIFAVLIVVALCIALIPMFALKGAEFGGSDDAGSQMVSEIQGEEYEPWFTPVLEQYLGRELPGELESLFFCLQTGIGVGIVAFFIGRLVERKKQETKYESILTEEQKKLIK